jgi:hypothetical protein
LVGPETDDGHHRWYFSLNNRRLWIFKRCREEGLLNNNQILVRVREPKSQSEIDRYTLDKCAVEAKMMREPNTRNKNRTSTNQGTDIVNDQDDGTNVKVDVTRPIDNKFTAGNSVDDDENDSSDCSNDSSDFDIVNSLSNRFSALH